uniref:CCHC-type domain-containing protein n=1 Tax=Xenopus tropicalis TaxID=8364 RepID=A0A1B8XVA9_XENTR
MAAFYKRQSKEALIDLCEQRGIDTSARSKESLVCALLESDQEQHNSTPEDCATQVCQVMDSAPHNVQDDGMSSLQKALELLGSDDPQLRLQLILQFQQAEAAERSATAEREAAERAAAAAERSAAAERELQLELAKLKQQTVPPQSSEPREVPFALPHSAKFPVMDKDSDLDTFLQSFEKTCRQYQLPREQWARHLTPGLKGKALDAFVELPPELDGDYDELKKALIKKYNLTPEVYRRKFRALNREPKDSYSDVVGNLRTTFRQWIKGLSINTLAELEDLMVKDQFLHICPAEVRQFVVDREPKTAAKAAEIADTYAASRIPEGRKASPPSRWERPTGRTAHSNPGSGERSSFWGSGAPVGQKDTRTCFSCNQTGHVRADCPLKKEPTPPVQPVVMLVSGKMENLAHHMQPVTVGAKVTQGLRDSGSNFSLVRPEIINTGDIIPGKTLSLKGVGGDHPKVPVAKVYLDWGVGRGLREVGVSNEIPVNVLLGNDLGCMLTAFVPSDPVSLGPAALECDHPPQQVTVTSKMQQSSWEGGLGDRSQCQPVPEPVVSQGGNQKGDGEEQSPLGVSLVQTGRVPVLRDYQRVVSDPVPKLPEVLSGGPQIGQTQESVQECGGQVVRTQSRVLVSSATQTGVKEGSWEPGIAPVPEPVLGEGLVVRAEEGLLMVPVAPKAATKQRVCPEGQGMWVEPSSLCRSGTEQVIADHQVGIDWVGGGQTVSEFRPREWGTRGRQEGPTCTQVTARTEKNQVGERDQVPTVSSYGLWPSTHTGTPCSKGKNKDEVNIVPIFFHSSAMDHVGKDPKEREFRPGR